MSWHYHVPGRVELVGKHTDYAGGCSVTCATSFQMHSKAEALREPVLRVHDLRGRASASVALTPASEPDSARWSVYLAAAARRVARDFPEAKTGVDITLGSTIPPSMGMSSSSALVVSVTMALFDANALWDSKAWVGVRDDELAFAQYCAAVESGAPWGPFAGDTGVGTRGGAQDHIAICASQAGTVGEYAYLPGRILRRERWPDEWRIVVANSGVKATKTGNARHAYNRVADSVRLLVREWNAEAQRSDETLAAALSSAPDAYDQLREIASRVSDESVSADYLRGRLGQYHEETTIIVPRMMDAIAAADTVAAGECLARSQEMAESGLGNQVPETEWLASHACELGAVGATAFGAGFGGAVWALVVDDAEGFATRWMSAFAAANGTVGRRDRARVFVPSAGAARSVS